MSLLMRLTNNSLSTMIAWVSTCLLSAGASTLFDESVQAVWLPWGCFGLAAAVGLDFAARVRERREMEELKITAAKRLERGIEFETEEKAANIAIREAVARMLGVPALQLPGIRRPKERYSCNLEVKLILHQDLHGLAGGKDPNPHEARTTNLSESGFELALTEALLPRQWITMFVVTVNHGHQTMLGEVLWCSPAPGGGMAAGGRFLDAVPSEATETLLGSDVVDEEVDLEVEAEA
jgi:hypothetical protein